MLYALASREAKGLIVLYRTKEAAEAALATVLADEPDFVGVVEILCLAPFEWSRFEPN